MTSEDIATLQPVWETFAFLIAPTPEESEAERTIRNLGKQFAKYRKSAGLTAQEVATRLGVSLSIIEGIERGNVQGRGGKFTHYWNYSLHLGVNMRQLFLEATLSGE